MGGAWILFGDGRVFRLLVWFRFSPRAVRHACGVLGVFLLSFVPEFLEGREGSLFFWAASSWVFSATGSRVRG
jgi:hypothetical protein